MFEVPGVRAQQAIVLAALRRHPGRSITVAALAAELNRGLGPDVARISNEDVECTLAALLLRSDLRASITITARPVAADERSHRLSLGHALLASTVLLAACATPFGPSTSKQKLAGYFGSAGTVPRAPAAIQTSGTPEYPSSLISCGDQLCLVKPGSAIAALSPKAANPRPCASYIRSWASHDRVPSPALLPSVSRPALPTESVALRLSWSLDFTASFPRRFLLSVVLVTHALSLLCARYRHLCACLPRCFR